MKYDFALCHKRMAGDCRDRRDPVVCRAVRPALGVPALARVTETDAMLELGLLLLGLLLGGAIGWAVVRIRGEAATRVAREGLQSRLAASESRSDELAKQLTQRDLDTSDVRRALELERQARTQAETRLASEREAIAEQRALLEEARTQLTARVQGAQRGRPARQSDELPDAGR